MNTLLTTSSDELRFASSMTGSTSTFSISVITEGSERAPAFVVFKVRATTPPRYAVMPLVGVFPLLQEGNTASGGAQIRVRLREAVPQGTDIDRLRVEAKILPVGHPAALRLSCAPQKSKAFDAFLKDVYDGDSSTPTSATVVVVADGVTDGTAALPPVVLPSAAPVGEVTRPEKQLEGKRERKQQFEQMISSTRRMLRALEADARNAEASLDASAAALRPQAREGVRVPVWFIVALISCTFGLVVHLREDRDRVSERLAEAIEWPTLGGSHVGSHGR
jgi:hypothetical protein